MIGFFLVLMLGLFISLIVICIDLYTPGRGINMKLIDLVVVTVLGSLYGYILYRMGVPFWLIILTSVLLGFCLQRVISGYREEL